MLFGGSALIAMAQHAREIVSPATIGQRAASAAERKAADLNVTPSPAPGGSAGAWPLWALLPTPTLPELPQLSQRPAGEPAAAWF
jgi:hypothetical protein